ncbi:MAG: type VII secretion protein EssC, partial [Culicoidibacterales bacterium]
AGYEHVQTLQSSIPEKVNYLEMFKVDRVEELNIPERWNSGEPRKTLSVPVGYRGSDDVVMLNLHEKAHGPHGLIAGTTGSGKSEIVQTYILSLATNFHPYDVAFLLIDYKGGGMANLFRDLPHLLGTITNLDSEQSKRALIAIKAELLQRQQLFSDNDVNHIDGYQKLFKEGLVEKPMPHLFIISDEFAELKSEQPEFMKELVSTARIGRSLGIHLILATQKPSGVVDDQIWSNSKFKLCLKVQDANDSNEMLKTPDAASITQAGRAYLQVGNNEIYELFQSAYSGSPYMVNVEKDDIRDNRIYEINELGQYELKTKDLSYGNVGKTSMSELAAVVGEIKKTFEEMKHEKVPSPWLEPLGEYITQDEYEKIDIKSEWLKFEQDNVTEQLEMIVGLTDEPQNQVQNTLKLNLVNGHIGLFGASGFGKSVMLQSLIMSLARKNTPEAIHFYILDFGQALLSLQFLPHVADLITIDEEEKIAKWIRLMESLIKERKRLFKEVGVADITTYRQLTGEKMNRIIVVLDNYDAVRDAELGDGFDKLLMLITREGIGLGIHVVISAMRSLKYQLMANIKEKITYFQVDSSDIPSIMGRTSMKIQEIPGRGLVKQDEIYEFQTLLPNAKQTQGERIENLRTEADLMQKLWTGQRPDSIPLVPEILTYEDFLMRKTVQFAMQQEHIISVGLDFEKVESINIDLRTDGNLLIAYDNILNFQKLLNSIIKTVTSQAMLYFVDSGRCELTMFKEEGIYDNTIDGIRSLLRDVFEIYENRKCQSEDEINSSQPIILIVNDPIALVSDVISEKNEYMIIDLLEKGRRFKIFTIWNIDVEKFNDFIGPLSKVVKKNQPALIMKKGQHFPPSLSVSRINYSEREFEEGEVNFIHHNRIQRIKYASK